MENFKKRLRTQIRAYHKHKAEKQEKSMWITNNNPKTLGSTIKEDTYGRIYKQSIRNLI